MYYPLTDKVLKGLMSLSYRGKREEKFEEKRKKKKEEGEGARTRRTCIKLAMRDESDSQVETKTSAMPCGIDRSNHKRSESSVLPPLEALWKRGKTQKVMFIELNY